MTYKNDQQLTQKFNDIRRICHSLWDEIGLRLPSITPEDVSKIEPRPKVVWINSFVGETHVGDLMIIARLAPALRALNMKLLCVTNPSARPLLEEDADVIEIIPNDQSYNCIKARLQTATHISEWYALWTYLERTFKRFSLAAPPYIAVSNSVTEQFRQEYEGDQKPVVGICWRTSLIGRKAVRDSHLDSWESLLNQRDYIFVSLQYGSQELTKEELRNAQASHGWKILFDDRIDAIGDLPTYAAQIKACDMVISVDCSTVFIAGALNVPTHTLICVEPSVRWDQGDVCPFFPSNKLFFQKEYGNWHQPIEAAADSARKTLTGTRQFTKVIPRPGPSKNILPVLTTES